MSPTPTKAGERSDRRQAYACLSLIKPEHTQPKRPRSPRPSPTVICEDGHLSQRPSLDKRPCASSGITKKNDSTDIHNKAIQYIQHMNHHPTRKYQPALLHTPERHQKKAKVKLNCTWEVGASSAGETYFPKKFLKLPRLPVLALRWLSRSPDHRAYTHEDAKKKVSRGDKKEEQDTAAYEVYRLHPVINVKNVPSQAIELLVSVLLMHAAFNSCMVYQARVYTVSGTKATAPIATRPKCGAFPA